MDKLQAELSKLWAGDEEGAGMVEYALLVVFIALVAIVGIALAGNAISNLFSDVAGSL